MDKKEQIETIIFELAGYSSICWSEIPTGVFEDSMCKKECEIAVGKILDLSQPKEVEPQTEITSAELWKNRYESLLKGLNDLTTELHVYKLNKDFDLDELKKRFELAFNFDYDCSFNNLWNFFLPHLQKPVESDAVEFNQNIVDEMLGLLSKQYDDEETGMNFKKTMKHYRNDFKQFKQLKK